MDPYSGMYPFSVFVTGTPTVATSSRSLDEALMVADFFQPWPIQFDVFPVKMMIYHRFFVYQRVSWHISIFCWLYMAIQYSFQFNTSQTVTLAQAVLHGRSGMRRPRVGVPICVLQFSKEKEHNSIGQIWVIPYPFGVG